MGWVLLAGFAVLLLSGKSARVQQAKAATKSAGGIGLFWLAVIGVVALAVAGH